MAGGVHQGDAGEFLRRLPRGSVRLVLTDPPYSTLTRGKMVYRNGLGWRPISWDRIAQHLRLARSRLRPGGALMIIVNRASLPLARQAMKDAGFARIRQIAWTSGHAIGGDPRKFRRGRTLLGRRRDYVLVGLMPAARIGSQRSVQALPVAPSKTGRYPTEKPTYLGQALARIARVRRGDLVVDPYAGSGALLEGAARQGARVAGSDTRAAAVRTAQRRLTKVTVRSLPPSGNVGGQRKGRRALGSRPRHSRS